MAATLETRHARFTVRHPSLLPRVLPLVRALDAVVERRTCGANAPGGGGFQPGNKCGKGDGGGGNAIAGEASEAVKAWAQQAFSNPSHAENFVRWFGDSKVVGDNGEPLLVHKGMPRKDWKTGQDIDAVQSTNGPWAGFFSDDKAVADRFAQAFKFSGDTQTLSGYAVIRKPHVIDAGGKPAKSVQFDQVFDGPSGPKVQVAPRIKEIIDSGQYDGIIIKNTSDEGTVFVPFNPESVKSSDNSGAFDPKSKNYKRYESRECGTNATGGGDRRAWCPGASPPDNSCSPHNKGGKGGGGGGGGASGGGSGKKGSNRPKQFDPSKSADRLVKKLSALDAKLQKKVDAAAKRVEKAKDAAAVAIQKMQSLDSAWISTREAWGADPENKAKERAHMRVQKQIEKAAQVHQDKVAAYAAAKEKHASALEEKAKAGREALKQEMAREVSDIAAADGMAAAHASARRSVEVAHADRLKRIRDPEARARIADGYAFMLEHTNPDIHKIALQPQLSVRGNVRAYAQRGGFDRDTFEAISPPTVVVSSRESASVVAHELGHCVEYNPEATRIARDFKERRVAGTTEVSFRSKFGYGYKSDERGSPDDFKKAHLAAGFDEKEADHRAHYTGKRYSSGSTEIVSMGVELLKRDPAAFARSDPEWFSLTTGLMTGRLLIETRQKRKAKS